MKKILLSILLIIVIVICYITYSELTYSPLETPDFQKIFKGYKNSDKICSKDFIGLSIQGELYDINLYSIKGAIIDNNFPSVVKWENKTITKENIISKWQHCPLDSLSNKLFKFTLNANNFIDLDCCNLFNKQLKNPNNYYCYIHFDEFEQYFFLYCTGTQELYYIRRRGF